MTDEWIIVPQTIILVDQTSNFNYIDYHLDAINQDNNQDINQYDYDNLPDIDDLEWYSCCDETDWIYINEEDLTIF